MQATFHPIVATAAALLTATALSACGGAIAASGESAGVSAVDSRAAADTIIEQAVADNPRARSGRVSASVDIDIDISGLPLLDGQTQITADGVYALPDGAALARAVTVAEGEAWIGKDDHVLRKARAHGRLVVAKQDRDLLYGLRTASIAAKLDVSEVGDDHTIAAPRSLASYSSLQLALSALAEAVRKDAGHR